MMRKTLGTPHGQLSWRWTLALFPLLFSLLLLGCAAVQPIEGGTANAFSRIGRFSLTVQTPDAPPQASQGGFAWNDDGRTLRVNLTNPVGSVLAQLRVSPERAVLVRSDGSQEAAQHSDALAARVFGRAVPVASLRVWLRGQTTAGAVQVQRDAQNHPIAFTQDGWRVQSSRFDAQGPRLLRLDRDDAGQRLTLRLVIDHE